MHDLQADITLRFCLRPPGRLDRVSVGIHSTEYRGRRYVSRESARRGRTTLLQMEVRGDLLRQHSTRTVQGLAEAEVGGSPVADEHALARAPVPAPDRGIAPGVGAHAAALAHLAVAQQLQHADLGIAVRAVHLAEELAVVHVDAHLALQRPCGGGVQRLARQQFRIAVVGVPNTGKSTLLNG
eukprot:COSAG02_NODE_29490_length_568_cov_0.823028_1_plen_182_part_01